MEETIVVRLYLTIGALLTAIITLPLPTWADSVTEAKLRFEQGAALINASEVRKGLNELLISNRLAPNPNTLFNVARSLEYLEYFEYAYLVYDEYLQSPSLSSTDRQEATDAFNRIEKKVARLNIETDPPGAEIYVDREVLGTYGKTPRRIATKPGPHQIILKSSLYETIAIDVNMKRGIEMRLSVALVPKKGTILLSTKNWDTLGPKPSVTVFYNGVVVGNADEELELPIGNQELTLIAEGYEPRVITVEVPEGAAHPTDDFDTEDEMDPLPLSTGKTPEVEIDLTPIQGTMRIFANETGALIYLDDQEVGFTPQVISAAVGQHQLRLELPGFKAWAGPVEVRRPPEQMVGEIEFRRPTDTGFHPAWAWTMAGVALGTASLSVALALEGNRLNERLPQYPTELEVADGNRYLLLADGAGVVSVLSALASYFLFTNQSKSTLDTPRARFYETTTPLEQLPPFEVPQVEPAEDEQDSSL